MKNMTLAHITEVCGGIYFGPEEKKTAEVTDIVTDSRKAGEGSLFVAIPGERVDGHKFIRTWLPRAHLLSFPSRNLKHRHARISS